jgi:thiol-disulfide isomerase/thioredoxin
MKYIFLIALQFPLILYAQEKGINFQKLTWAEFKEKAARENKFIFLDCYATWCGPCKLMDKQVYSLPAVGDTLNEHFLSAKVQIDSSQKDDDYIKSWYADARAIRDQYLVFEYPTYLFFSPGGKIVHRGIGAIRDSDFIKLAKNALTPGKQYYTLVDNYKQGKKNYQVMAYLANRARAFHDDSLSRLLGTEYITNYLLKMDKRSLFTRQNIEFISTNTQSSADTGFWVLYHQQRMADSVMNKNYYAEDIIDNIIMKEEIEDKLWQNGKLIYTHPDWEQLRTKLRLKYNGSHVEKVILNAKIRWANDRSNWSAVTAYYLKKLKTYGLDTSDVGWAVTNNIMYDVIFKYCNDKGTLNEAVKWQNKLVDTHPGNENILDTYANLLYKAGSRNEALKWEKKAALIAPKNSEIKATLQKMRKGIPTWE